MQAKSVQEIDCADDERRLHRKPDEGVRDAAMMLKGGDWTPEAPERVDVGELGSGGHGEGGVRGSTVETGSGEAGARQNMSDRFHSCCSLARYGHGLHNFWYFFFLGLAGREHRVEFSGRQGFRR